MLQSGTLRSLGKTRRSTGGSDHLLGDLFLWGQNSLAVLQVIAYGNTLCLAIAHTVRFIYFASSLLPEGDVVLPSEKYQLMYPSSSGFQHLGSDFQ